MVQKTKTTSFVQRLFPALLLAISANSFAGSVQQVDVFDMISGSELVVHGEVVDRWTETGGDQFEIYTHIRIRVLDLIKGQLAADSVELQFLGGSNGRFNLHVSDQYVPPVGDEAIYFIEKAAIRQVNPIYGWHQGHFPIRFNESQTEKRPLTFDLRPIFDIQPETSPNPTVSSGRIAKGIVYESPVDQRPLDLTEFKLRLRHLVEVLR